MTSNDQQQYLTVDMFNSRMDTLMAQIRLENEKLRSELKAEIQDVRSISLVNSAKIEMLQHTFYWGFGIMTIVIAIIAVLVPYLFREHKEKKQEQTVLTEEKVQDMISRTVNDAVTKVLGVPHE